jgi:hypothetical protein
MRTRVVSSTVGGLVLLMSSAAFAQISFGIQLGAPPPPRAYVVPAQPGPEFVWVEGYWYPQAGRYLWHDGYWSRPPYEGAYWVAPYHDRGRYVAGYWDGPHGRFEHDHRWDHEAERRDEARERREERDERIERREDRREDRHEDRHDDRR